MTRKEAHERAVAAVNAAGGPTEGKPDIDEAGVVAFHEFLINEYTPPADKRFLVFFQCCVGRQQIRARHRPWSISSTWCSSTRRPTR